MEIHFGRNAPERKLLNWAQGSKNERPGGATEITENFSDGQTQSVTGTGVVPRFYDYGVNPDGSQWTMVRTGRTNSPMWD